MTEAQLIVSFLAGVAGGTLLGASVCILGASAVSRQAMEDIAKAKKLTRSAIAAEGRAIARIREAERRMADAKRLEAMGQK